MISQLMDTAAWKRTHIAILATIALLVLTGCATSYQSSGFTGGFQESQLAPDIFEVSFNGNGYTSGKRTRDYTMLRAAEICQGQGFSFFLILERDNSATTHSYTTPGQSYTTGTAYAYGNTATYYGQTTHTPGQTHHFVKPSSSMTIKLLRTKPTEGIAYEAAFLIKSLKKQYGVE